MRSDHYPRVIQEWCKATGMQPWGEREDVHVEIDDTLVGLCGGQVISDTAIGFFAAMFRSKTAGGRLPNTEFSRSLL